MKNKQIIPAPEPDSIPDSSSPDSCSPGAGSIPEESSPEAGSIPDESSPEADSMADKIGKIKLRVIVTHQYIKAMIKKTAYAIRLLIFTNLVLRGLFTCLDYCGIQNDTAKRTPPKTQIIFK